MGDSVFSTSHPLSPVEVVMGLFVPFQPAPADYPNHLTVPQPECIVKRDSPAFADHGFAAVPAKIGTVPWLLLLLVVLCLIPRVLMALRIPSVCPTACCIHLAQAIEAGDWRSGFGRMALNIYPIILMLLHRIGLGWESAAAVWGVTISSLVVLPLWGWARRQFDNRVALVACLLYAVHPKLIEWSPEAMRDPTFWFLFMLAIYWLWRAVTEVRYGYFIAGGAAITLASLTRIEGLFLLVPLGALDLLAVSGLANGSQTARARRGAVRGGVSRAAGAGQCRLDVRTLGLGVDSAEPAGPSPAMDRIADGSCGREPRHRQPRKAARRRPDDLGLLSDDDARVFAGVCAIDVRRPLGMAARVVHAAIISRCFHRRGHYVRHLGAIVVRQEHLSALRPADRADGLAVCRVGAAGTCRAVVVHRRMAAMGRAAAAPWWRPPCWPSRPSDLTDAMTCNRKYFETRRMAVDLGRWMRSRYPTPPAIVGPMDIAPITSFYADGSPYATFRWEANDASILRVADRNRAAIVLLQPVRNLYRRAMRRLGSSSEAGRARSRGSQRVARVVRSRSSCWRRRGWFRASGTRAVANGAVRISVARASSP